MNSVSKFLSSSLLIAMLAVSPALAAIELPVSGSLTEEQKAQLSLDAAKLIKQNKEKAEAPIPMVPPATIDQVSKYAELGKTIGASLASTAKEMGVAANEFAATPIGLLATAIITYKLIGHDIFHFFAGSMWFVVMLPSWLYMFRRMCLIREVKIIPNPDGKFAKTRIVSFQREGDCDGTRVAMFFALAILILIGMLVTFT